MPNNSAALPIKILAAGVLASVVGANVRAAMKEDIREGGRKLMEEPWGLATLIDAYGGFALMAAWAAYRERSVTAKIAWPVAFLALGNIATAGYILKELSPYASTGDGESVEGLLLGENQLTVQPVQPAMAAQDPSI